MEDKNRKKHPKKQPKDKTARHMTKLKKLAAKKKGDLYKNPDKYNKDESKTVSS